MLSDSEGQIPQRSFSVANKPRSDGAVSLLVTLVQGGATSTWVHQLHVGEKVLFEGPFGTFVTESDRTSPVLLLAAGSGLAPCRALVQALLTSEPRRAVTLFFSGRLLADAIDKDIFKRYQDDYGEFRYLLTCTREQHAPDLRRPDARIPALLPDMVGDLEGWEVFAAGPSDFVAACATLTESLGAARRDIKTEEFFVDPKPWTKVVPSSAI